MPQVCPGCLRRFYLPSKGLEGSVRELRGGFSSVLVLLANKSRNPGAPVMTHFHTATSDQRQTPTPGHTPAVLHLRSAAAKINYVLNRSTRTTAAAYVRLIRMKIFSACGKLPQNFLAADKNVSLNPVESVFKLVKIILPQFSAKRAATPVKSAAKLVKNRILNSPGCRGRLGDDADVLLPGC